MNTLSNKKLRTQLPIWIIIGLCASCSSTTQIKNQARIADKWINPEPAEGVNFDYQAMDWSFYLTFTAINNDEIPAANCYELEFINPYQLKDATYTDWQKITATCAAAKAHFRAPEQSTSYWPENFQAIKLSTFPATAYPYTGTENLHINKANNLLIDDNNTQSIAITTENTQALTTEKIEATYTLLSRGDFNNDNIEDLFIQIDWTLKDDGFKDSDWIVMTKNSFDSQPYLLWRRL